MALEDAWRILKISKDENPPKKFVGTPCGEPGCSGTYARKYVPSMGDSHPICDTCGHWWDMKTQGREPSNLEEERPTRAEDLGPLPHEE
jgi:hypothetical protein